MPQFSIRDQEHSLWCWAAVTAGVEAFFDAGGARSQCQVARDTLGRRTCCASSEQNPCNQAAALEKALATGPNFDGAQEGSLEFAEIEQRLNNGLPVCARIGWSNGGGHFVVISGFSVSRTGRRSLFINDPARQTPDDRWGYEDFRDAYLGRGRWTATYFVKRGEVQPRANRHAANS